MEGEQRRGKENLPSPVAILSMVVCCLKPSGPKQVAWLLQARWCLCRIKVLFISIYSKICSYISILPLYSISEIQFYHKRCSVSKRSVGWVVLSCKHAFLASLCFLVYLRDNSVRGASSVGDLPAADHWCTHDQWKSRCRAVYCAISTSTYPGLQHGPFVDGRGQDAQVMSIPCGDFFETFFIIHSSQSTLFKENIFTALRPFW